MVNGKLKQEPLAKIQEYDPTWFVDLEATSFNDNWRVTVGGRNVGDEYPEKDKIGDYCCGRTYASGSHVDWQGAFYYGRVDYGF